jgi:hypothetical protein
MISPIVIEGPERIARDCALELAAGQAQEAGPDEAARIVAAFAAELANGLGVDGERITRIAAMHLQASGGGE